MSKRQLILDLDDIRIKGFVNRGYGMLEDGVTNSSNCIIFENVYNEEAPYPMYAVNLSDYLSEEGIDIHDIETIDIFSGDFGTLSIQVPDLVDGLTEQFSGV